jgi:hypothetical protein
MSLYTLYATANGFTRGSVALHCILIVSTQRGANDSSDDTEIDVLFAALFGHSGCEIYAATCDATFFLGVNDPPECTSINGNEHFGTETYCILENA